MRYILLFLQVSFILSCNHISHGELKSEWSKLQQAKNLSCRAWPVKDEYLDLSEITVMNPWSFLLSGRTRDGLSYQDWMKLDSPSPSLDKQRSLKWGFGSEYLTSWKNQTVDFVFLATYTQGEFKTLQVRELASNAVHYSFDGLPEHFVPLQAIKVTDGLWLAYKLVDEDSSVDVSPLRFSKYIFSNDRKLKKTSDISTQISSEYRLFSLAQDRVGGVFYRQQKDGNSFFSFELNENKIKTSPINLKFPDRVESWDFVKAPHSLVLAVVEGDSLLWEKSKLKIAQLDESFSLIRERGFPIENEHVGEPRLVSDESKAYLFIPKWLDYESSLEVYEIAATDLSLKGYFGIFEEGTYFDKVIYDNDENTFLILNQSPSERLRVFQYCNLAI